MHLTVITPEPNASVVEMLEAVLQQAYTGEITNVAIATVLRDGSIGSWYSTTDDFGRLLGSVSRLQFRLNINQKDEDG